MNPSSLVSVLACCAIGCGAAVQPGLANAPVLGGATPETRVHDAIANGRDACERAMFPQGEVLRGQVPPCSKDSQRSSVALSPHEANAVAPPTLPSWLWFCAAGNRSLWSGAKEQATAIASSWADRPSWLCDDRLGADEPVVPRLGRP
jgi:hypothetical protein